jgi:hypothetical protein
MFTFIVLSQFLNTAVAQLPDEAAALHDDSRALAKYILAGLRSEHDSFRSGVFRATGTLVRRASSAKSRTRKIQLFCAFDTDRGVFRFDRHELGTPPDNANPDQHCIYIRTRDQSIHSSDSGPASVTTIRPPEHKPLCRPFDARLIGLAMPQELERLSHAQFMNFFDSQQEVAEVDRIGETYRVTWVSGRTGGLRRTIWFDEGIAFAPIRFEFRAKEGSGVSNIMHSMEAKWTRTAGTVVPIEFVSSDPRADEVMELTFTWDGVNTPIPENYFTIDGLALEDGAYVADSRLKPAVLVEIVGQQERTPPQVPTRTAEPTTAQAGQSIWIIAGACAVVGVVVMVWFVRRQTRVER